MAAVGRQVLALGLGAGAGYAAYRAGMPLPWMLGPMLANTIAAIGRAPVAGPVWARPYVVPVIGVMLGSAVTAEVFSQLGEWGVTLLLMLPFLFVAAGLSFLIYRRLGGYDRVTAFYSAMPGGLNEMLLAGIDAGGHERRIAVAHASRILIVVLCIGLYFGFVLGVRPGAGGVRPWIGLDALGWLDWAVLAACALIGAPLGKVLRIPAGNVLGPMILSAVAHVFHLVEIAPPTLIVNSAQIVLGTVIGCRFLGSALREIGLDLRLGLMSSVSMMTVAVIFAQITGALTGTPPSQVFLAYSPGGLTEMSLLALAMGQDVAYVSVMHILRILLVIGIAPSVFKRFALPRA
jgi:hypothetical protein